MFEESFERLYLQFRASYYRSLVQTIGSSKGDLTATECFSVEIIYLLGAPTISEFAQFLKISLPNANYKINNLVEKGYVEKDVSDTDKREVRLKVTNRFLDHYGLNNQEYFNVMKRIRENFTEEEIGQLENALDRVGDIMEQTGKKGGNAFD